MISIRCPLEIFVLVGPVLLRTEKEFSPYINLKNSKCIHGEKGISSELLGSEQKMFGLHVANYCCLWNINLSCPQLDLLYNNKLCAKTNFIYNGYCNKTCFAPRPLCAQNCKKKDVSNELFQAICFSKETICISILSTLRKKNHEYFWPKWW